MSTIKVETRFKTWRWRCRRPPLLLLHRILYRRFGRWVVSGFSWERRDSRFHIELTWRHWGREMPRWYYWISPVDLIRLGYSIFMP